MVDYIVLDIGNTNIHIGCFSNECDLKFRRVFPSDKIICKDSISKEVFCKKHSRNKPVILVSSVNPPIEREIIDYLTINKLEYFVFGKDFTAPLKLKVRNKTSVGSDRLANAYAAVRIYKKDAIVVDIGTACTIDVVSKKMEFLGGVIIPGYSIQIQALKNYCALLKNINVQFYPNKVVGKDTNEAISVGVYNAFFGAVGYIVQALKQKYPSSSVLLTGGGSRFIKSKAYKFFKYVDIWDVDLTLKGILYAYRDSNSYAEQVRI